MGSALRFLLPQPGPAVGQEFPKFADDEATFADLYQRIEKTLEFVRGFKPEQINDTEDKAISFEVRGKR